MSYPFGGKNRQVMVDLDLNDLYAKHLSPIDVSNALNLQNLIVPAGTAKFAGTEYPVRLNSSLPSVSDFNNLPIKTVNGATIYMKDVATVHDGFVPQTNIVRTNGSRGVLLTVTRNGKASTLAIVNAVKDELPRIMGTVTQDLKLSAFGDQSLFVRSAIGGVVRETLIAAVLTGLVILLFLGSWRSTLIVCISIPLSILSSICILSVLGQTINVMTLGGLALAVGILVDDATVEIENTHRNLAMRKPLVRAVLDGASQIAVPTFVSTLSICIVFVPVLLLTGTAQYLFTPLAMAVVFAMMASYLLSRTLVPTMVRHMLRSEVVVYQSGGHGGQGMLWSLHRGMNDLLRTSSRAVHRSARLVARAAGAGARRVSADRARFSRAGADRRTRFFPQRGRRHVAASRAHGAGHAHRADRGPFRRRRAGDPPDAAGRRARHDSRQHRNPQRLEQPRAGRRPEYRGDRRRDPDFAQS